MTAETDAQAAYVEFITNSNAAIKGDKDAMYAGADLKATVSNSNKGKFAKKSKVAAAPAEDEGDAVI